MTEENKLEYPDEHPRAVEIGVKKEAMNNTYKEIQVLMANARNHYREGNEAYKKGIDSYREMGKNLKEAMDKLKWIAKTSEELKAIIDAPKI